MTRFYVLLLLILPTLSLAQSKMKEPFVWPPVWPPRKLVDTISAQTEPIEGYGAFKRRLERVLSAGDTIGKNYQVIDLWNIGFIVSKEGKIDSAWLIKYRSPLHYKVIEYLKETPWKPAEKDSITLASRQSLNFIRIQLTKKALKKYSVSYPSSH